jgi:NADH dehydrogenase
MAMNKYVRRGTLGTFAGLVCSVVLAFALGNAFVGMVLGLAIGLGYGWAVGLRSGSYLDSGMAAAALAVPLWATVSVILLPLAAGEEPYWTTEGMRLAFPAFVGWILYSVSLGLVARALWDFAPMFLGPEPPRAALVPAVRTRIVILGGGFAGVTTALHLERVFGADPSIVLTLVSDTNALLFTPMLAEVAGGSLEAAHISSPLRTSLRRTAVIRGRVAAIDFEQRRVQLAPGARVPGASADTGKSGGGLAYDQLVLALGAVSSYGGLSDVQATAFEFKSLTDAIRIRHHVIDMFERADSEADPEVRGPMLTFVVAGGGFAGAELAGALNDFTRGMLAYYPNIPPDEVKVVLVHSRERILPELSEPLAGYALRQMAVRGILFKLNTRVRGAREGVVLLQPAPVAAWSGDQAATGAADAELRTRTLVWTAGTAPHPLLQTLPVPLDRRGGVIVDPTLAVPGCEGVWALGDCAAIPNGYGGATCPPTAQFAVREAVLLAHNIRAWLKGRSPKAFHCQSFGSLCMVGYHTACAEIKGLRFSGLFAWLLWRAIYLRKLPGFERKLRVLVDWLLDLFFPRDTVQTLDLDPHGKDDP